MKNLLGDMEIEIPCENCGTKAKKTIRWIKCNTNYTCSCGTRITLKANQFRGEIAKVERSLTALDAELKKLGEH